METIVRISLTVETAKAEGTQKVKGKDVSLNTTELTSLVGPLISDLLAGLPKPDKEKAKAAKE